MGARAIVNACSSRLFWNFVTLIYVLRKCSIELLSKYQLHFFYIPAGHKVERYYTDSEIHPRPKSEFIPFYVRMNT